MGDCLAGEHEVGRLQGPTVGYWYVSGTACLQDVPADIVCLKDGPGDMVCLKDGPGDNVCLKDGPGDMVCLKDVVGDTTGLKDIAGDAFDDAGYAVAMVEYVASCDLAGDTDLPRATTTVLGTLALWNGFSLDHVHVDCAVTGAMIG
mgnify:FL=1